MQIMGIFHHGGGLQELEPEMMKMSASGRARVSLPGTCCYMRIASVDSKCQPVTLSQ